MQLRIIPVDENRRETTLHGSFEFPLAVYRTDLSQTVLGYVNWHWHDEVQFCLVTAGAVRFSVGDRQCLRKAGEGLFVGSRALHTARPEGDPHSTYLCLDVHPRLLSSFPGSVYERDYVAPFLTDEAMSQVPLSADVPWQREILTAMTEIADFYEAKARGYELEIASKLPLMWGALIKNRPPEKGLRASSRKNEAARAILTYIEGHYGEPLTLLDVALAVSFSTAECCRIFKKVTGQTIFSYLQSYRLTKGTELLAEGLPVSLIAYEVGFCSTSYFIEVFKRQFGMTPLQYRKKCEGKDRQ